MWVSESNHHTQTLTKVQDGLSCYVRMGSHISSQGGREGSQKGFTAVAHAWHLQSSQGRDVSGKWIKKTHNVKISIPDIFGYFTTISHLKYEIVHAPTIK